MAKTKKSKRVTKGPGMAERRNLKMHPKILWDVISKQAGTLAKAVLEGAMNSIDAGGTRCDITLEPGHFVIVDDGKGFTSRRVIEKCFETFGTPHIQGDATFGRFRMGRGQIFSFGRNRWASNEFRMHVDFKGAIARWDEHDRKVAEAKAAAKAAWETGGRKGNLDDILDEVDARLVDNFDFSLGYDLEEGREPVKGCRIEVDLYKPLLPSELDATLREIKEYLAWAPIPITVNGKQVNKSAAEHKWDIVTDDAWIALKDKGTLDVYNLGVLVCRIPAHRYGTGGVVVSKQQLDVNFARNDIQSTCKVWGRIAKHLRSEMGAKNKKKAKLTDAERQSLFEQFMSGEVSLDEALDLQLLTDVTGSHHKLSRLETASDKYQARIAAAETGDHVAETAHGRRLAFVLSKVTLDQFGVASPEELLKVLRARVSEEVKGVARYRFAYCLESLKAYDRAKFDEFISSDHVTLDPKELKPAERLAVEALQAGSMEMSQALLAERTLRGLPTPEDWNWRGREIRVGLSDTAEAWTDGSNIIWIRRDRLPLVQKGFPGLARLAALMLHEYLHDKADTASHVHDIEFYKRHHDLAMDTDIIGQTADRMFKRLINLIRQEQKKPTGALKGDEDRVAQREMLPDLALETEPKPEPKTAPRAAESGAAATAAPKRSMAAREAAEPKAARGQEPRRQAASARADTKRGDAADDEPMLPLFPAR